MDGETGDFGCEFPVPPCPFEADIFRRHVTPPGRLLFHGNRNAKRTRIWNTLDHVAIHYSCVIAYTTDGFP
jgi:hypothetical protein